MIEQTATVVSVEAGYAWVVPQQRAGGCGACKSGGSCATSSPLAFLSSKESQKMRVLNPLYARPGDQVVVGMQGEALVVYSLLAYLVPLLALLFAAFVGREAFAFLGFNTELGAMLAGVAGLLGGLRFANLLSVRSLDTANFQPVILRTKESPIYGQIIPSP
ncbi:SoxR reducing system RseC family protein [Candidatus Thiothrix anitrata]|uniref:SoxR reducing system RseC family protein n=1 Tax=Candidatus Thiothrix anitrata TaxID=2823902 RepID=A0ABX7X4R4_9GAMM|nr:SoxR reducing system RseC family protein [Candidatus Thiothrix anitrata]QTR49593.1 SoxR reducing system RseC family protein [Candidatus Thiothrix anitrata]